MRAEEKIKEKKKTLNSSVSSKLSRDCERRVFHDRKKQRHFLNGKNLFSLTSTSQWEGSVMRLWAFFQILEQDCWITSGNFIPLVQRSSCKNLFNFYMKYTFNFYIFLSFQDFQRTCMVS